MIRLLLLGILLFPAGPGRAAPEMKAQAPAVATTGSLELLESIPIPHDLELEPVPEAEMLSREAAIALALQQNQALKAAADQLEGARGDAVHFSAANNPTLGVGVSYLPRFRDYQDFPQIRDFPDSDLTCVSYVLPTSGRRYWATRSAAGRLEAARATYEQARLDLMLAVKIAYANLQQAQELRAIHVDILRIAAGNLALTKKSFQAGAIGQTDVRAGEITHAQARQTLLSSGLDVLAKEAALGAQLGRLSTRRVGASDPLNARPVSEPLETLLERAYRQRPAVRAAGASLAGLRAQIDVAKAGRRPDTTLWHSIYWQTTNSGAVPVYAATSLPVYDRGQIGGLVITARAAARQAEWHLEKAKLAVWKDVQTAFLNVRADLATLEVSQSRVLPRTYDLVRRTRLGYAAGATTVLDVLNAQQLFRQAAISRLGAAVRLEQDLAYLERAVGGPVERAGAQELIRPVREALDAPLRPEPARSPSPAAP
jgi:cobalt-zinc-cadmium efflux system outer membrane protein